MPHIHTQFWSLEVPEEWRIENNEETGAVSVSDPDDIGCLDLLVVQSDDGEQFGPLESFIADCVLDETITELPALTAFNLVGLEGFTLRYLADDLVWREWYLAGPEFIIMITYNTEKEQAGLDDALVDQILETFVLEPGLERLG